MTGRKINLTELRELANGEALSQKEFDAVCDAIPALVEAVEAAQRVIDRPAFNWASPQVGGLIDALARFDFGSPSGLVAGKDNAAGEGTER